MLRHSQSNQNCPALLIAPHVGCGRKKTISSIPRVPVSSQNKVFLSNIVFFPELSEKPLLNLESLSFEF